MTGLKQELLTKCLSINSPVAPQSTRAETDFFSAVSVVSISTFNLNDVGFSSVAAMTNFWGRDLSHFGQQVQTEGVMDGKASIGNIFTEKVGGLGASRGTARGWSDLRAGVQ